MDFFTADEHHGHENAMLGWGRVEKARPWTSLDGMTEGLIERHNDVVKDGDTVWHLGDMFWRTLGYDKAEYIMSRLNGAHRYVKGNHEELLESNAFIARLFESVEERVFLRPISQKRIVLDHYAGRVWRDSHKGSIQLYGHSHGELAYAPDLLSMDVGVDANDFTPVSLDTVYALMERKNNARIERERLRLAEYNLKR